MSQEPDLFGAQPDPAPFAGAALYVSRAPAIASAFNPDATAILTGAALRDVIAERIAQIDRRGFSLQADASRGPAFLAGLSRQYLQIAIDRLSAAPELRHPAAARKRMVEAAALALAAIDALDAAEATPFPEVGAADPGIHLPKGPPAGDAGDAPDDLIFDDDQPEEEI